MSGLGMLFGVLYLGLVLTMLGTWIYLLMKVGEISRSAAAIAVQLELQSRILASLAESVVVLARTSAEPKPELSAPTES